MERKDQEYLPNDGRVLQSADGNEIGTVGDAARGEVDAPGDGKYRLYVGRLQSVPEWAEFSYYDSERRRLFILSDRTPEGRFYAFPDSLYGELTDGEKTWYNASCFAIMHRWMEAHENEAEETANAFLDQFEQELKNEAEKGLEIGDGRESSGIPSGGG